MAEPEGTIQFAYTLSTPEPEFDLEPFAELIAWRHILHNLGFVRRRDTGACGFFSQRGAEDSFVITTQQSAEDVDIGWRDLVDITHYNVNRSWIEAVGAEPPSEDALLHAMIYGADPRIRCVIQAPLTQLGETQPPTLLVPAAPSTTALHQGVSELLDGHQSRPLVFAIADETADSGTLFACAANHRDAAESLIRHHARNLIEAQKQ